MNIPKNITVASLDKLSYVAIPLKILSKMDNELSTCTGFIYQRNSKYYLISNWHCFTGKNPNTKKPLNGDFVLPAKIQVPFHKTKEPFISWERTNFDLIDESTNPLWFIHPEHKQEVDVVALEIEIPKDVFIHAINQQDLDNYDPMIADDVFILGFPYNFKGGGNTLKMMKIWRKFGVDKIMQKAADKGIVLSGLSAGSICWFRYGNSDSARFGKNKEASMMRVKGLDMIPALHCPHYDIEKGREGSLKNMMKKNSVVAIAIDNCSAIEIIGDQYRILKSKKIANSYKVFWKGGKYFKELIPSSKELQSLEVLLKK